MPHCGIATCGTPFIGNNTIIISPTKLVSSFPIRFQFSARNRYPILNSWNTCWAPIEAIYREIYAVSVCVECCEKGDGHKFKFPCHFILTFWVKLSNYQTNLIVLHRSQLRRRLRSFVFRVDSKRFNANTKLKHFAARFIPTRTFSACSSIFRSTLTEPHIREHAR